MQEKHFESPNQESNKDIYEIERNGWHLTYTSEFNQLRELRPDLISYIYSLAEGKNISTDTDSATNSNYEGAHISVEPIGTKANKKYFVISIGDEKYFMKKISIEKGNGLEAIEDTSSKDTSSSSSITNQGGVEEFKDTHTATELLRDIHGVSVIGPIFAYSNPQHHFSIAKWNAFAELTIADLLRKIEQEDEALPEKLRLDTATISSIHSRTEAVKKALVDFNDVTELNMSYDPETDTVLVFDINKKKKSLAEVADDEL